MALDLDYLMDSLLVLKGENELTIGTQSGIDLATSEMIEIYKEREPYSTNRLITGIEYVFSETFILKVRYAMATDYIGDMNNAELLVWNYFVQYSDEFSTTANTTVNPDAIGCTVPDINGNSYIVTEAGITTDLCSYQVSELEAIELASALDIVLTKIANCEEWVAQTITTSDLENVSVCTL